MKNFMGLVSDNLYLDAGINSRIIAQCIIFFKNLNKHAFAWDHYIKDDDGLTAISFSLWNIRNWKVKHIFIKIGL